MSKSRRNPATLAYGIALLGTAVAVGATAVAIHAVSEPPRTVVITNTVTVEDAACAEYAGQVAQYAADVTASLDTVTFLYDQGVEYHWSIRADNYDEFAKRLAYITDTYSGECK